MITGVLVTRPKGAITSCLRVPGDQGGRGFTSSGFPPHSINSLINEFFKIFWDGIVGVYEAIWASFWICFGRISRNDKHTQLQKRYCSLFKIAFASLSPILLFFAPSKLDFRIGTSELVTREKIVCRSDFQIKYSQFRRLGAKNEGKLKF